MLAVVCDSSPLVYLSKLQQFRLLRLIYDAVLVPPAVWHEVTVGGQGLAESENLKTAVAEGWMRVETPSAAGNQAANLPPSLGRGEVEAIMLACEKGAVLVTDDGLGRSLAVSLGLQVTGTVGVLIQAKRQGHLSSIRPLMDQLRLGTNFRMSEPLYRKAMDVAGESVPTDSH